MPDPDLAVARADQVLQLILQHQPGAVAATSLRHIDNATETAKAIAAFRLTLIEELRKQP